MGPLPRLGHHLHGAFVLAHTQLCPQRRFHDQSTIQEDTLRSPAWVACGAVRPAKLTRWLQLRASLGRRPPDHAAAASVLLGLGRIVVSEKEAPVLLVNLV